MDAHDHGDVEADPLRFQEAIDAFLKRVPMTQDEYDQLEEAEQEFAFTVANVAQADLVADVYESLQAAIAKGKTFDEFRADVGEDLANEWGGDDPSRLETIYRTNVMDAYNGGRYAQQTAPATIAARPYGRWDVIEDARTSEDICLPIGTANVVVKLNSPWAQRHYPPLHYCCRTIVTGISQEEAEDTGITESPPDVEALPGFGDAPAGAGSDWEPDPDDYPSAIGDILEERLDEEPDADASAG